MPTFRIVSPERRWRAASLVLLAAWVIWRAVRYAGPLHLAGLVLGCLVAAVLLGFVVPVMRTCLIVSDEDLTDRRAVRRVRVAWPQVAEFRPRATSMNSSGFAGHWRSAWPAAAEPAR